VSNRSYRLRRPRECGSATYRLFAGISWRHRSCRTPRRAAHCQNSGLRAVLNGLRLTRVKMGLAVLEAVVERCHSDNAPKHDPKVALVTKPTFEANLRQGFVG